jgi:hypothetical protein
MADGVWLGAERGSLLTPLAPATREHRNYLQWPRYRLSVVQKVRMERLCTCSGFEPARPGHHVPFRRSSSLTIRPSSSVIARSVS